MTTPHLEAPRGAIADTVLLPGDPLRARHIAQAFLDAPREVNARRNMLGYTGTAGGMQLPQAGLGAVFNMGGAAVANYLSILEAA